MFLSKPKGECDLSRILVFGTQLSPCSTGVQNMSYSFMSTIGFQLALGVGYFEGLLYFFIGGLGV